MKTEYRVETGSKKIIPMGLWEEEGRIFVSFASRCSRCGLVLYRKGSKRPETRIPFPEAGRTGDVWTMTVYGTFAGMEYTFEEDGKEVPDPYGASFRGRERWGDKNRGNFCPRTPLGGWEEYDWEGDSLPGLSFQDSILYHIHPRGFTKHTSSGVEGPERGTFKGIQRKIPYMKELGVTTVVLMPPVEFNEVLPSGLLDGSPFEPEPEEQEEIRLNYWGYAKGLAFAPKAAYSSGSQKDPVREMKDMVKAFHREGMEVMIQLFFDGTESPSYALDLARFWVREYHVDGLHLIGFAPWNILGEDPYLSRTKLLGENWYGVKPGDCRHLAQCGPGFMLDMRGFLKGDEGKLDQAAFHTRHNSDQVAVVNYMAGVNGFTLSDMVSYDQKHNEANGEDNRDGTDYNQSWNCGVEGPTRKKKVLQMRRRQLRNAILLLFLSQGTPLIMAGDEFGRTQKGNNNAYCQDNEISWVNWSLLKTNHSMWEFVRRVIAFRKEHGLFHMAKEPALLDYDSQGLPDVSYHGLKAWCPEFDSFRRQLGIFYCGHYGRKPDNSPDDYFYVAYNMHWEPQEFALPHLPKGLKWHVAFDTYEDSCNGIYEEGNEPLVEDQKRTMVMARTIMVLIGKAPEKSRKGKEKEEENEYEYAET